MCACTTIVNDCLTSRARILARRGNAAAVAACLPLRCILPANALHSIPRRPNAHDKTPPKATVMASCQWHSEPEIGFSMPAPKTGRYAVLACGLRPCLAIAHDAPDGRVMSMHNREGACPRSLRPPIDLGLGQCLSTRPEPRLALMFITASREAALSRACGMPPPGRASALPDCPASPSWTAQGAG